jgi:anaerobic selenocysteine-containing dehydrogenase
MIVSVDTRITTTGMYSDYILPAAQHHEKVQMTMPSVHHLNCVLADRVVPPAGESLSDHKIGIRLVEAIEQRAAARGISEFSDRSGNTRSLLGLTAQATLDGALRDEDAHFDETIRDNAVYGVLPPGTTLDTLREKGAVRFTGWGMVGHGVSQASTDGRRSNAAGTLYRPAGSVASPQSRKSRSKVNAASSPRRSMTSKLAQSVRERRLSR